MKAGGGECNAERSELDQAWGTEDSWIRIICPSKRLSHHLTQRKWSIDDHSEDTLEGRAHVISTFSEEVREAQAPKLNLPCRSLLSQLPQFLCCCRCIIPSVLGPHSTPNY